MGTYGSSHNPRQGAGRWMSTPRTMREQGSPSSRAARNLGNHLSPSLMSQVCHLRSREVQWLVKTTQQYHPGHVERGPWSAWLFNTCSVNMSPGIWSRGSETGSWGHRQETASPRGVLVWAENTGRNKWITGMKCTAWTIWLKIL